MMRLLDILKIFKNVGRSGVNSKMVTNSIEHVIDSIDVKLRLVPSYKQKLHDAVSASLMHIDDLVNQVPGPFDMSRKNYVSDPNVSAYFASPDLMQDVFSNSEELKTFFSDSHNHDADCCYALLCSNKQEKTVMGTQLVNGHVQHDVMQTAVHFFDYKVLSPAINVYEVRKCIKQCIFDGLITHALQHIANIKIERRDLLDQQRILHSQLRARQTKGSGLSGMLAEADAGKWQSEKFEKEYKETGKRLEKMLGKQDVFSFYLNEIKQIFSKPEDFIQLNVACFRLSDMRIKVDDKSPQAANTVCFSELEIANVMKRVVAVVSYSRDEMK
jgi:hypothetical protein